MLKKILIPFSTFAPARCVMFAQETPEKQVAPKPEVPKNPNYNPSGEIPPDAKKAEAAEKKDPKKLRTERLTEALAKKTDTLSMHELRTLATSEVGREKILTDASGLKFEQVKEGQTIAINLGGEAEMTIGAGDMLPINVRDITVVTKKGETLKGTRAPNPENPFPPRVGYFSQAGEYVPVFSGDKITIGKIANAEELQALEKSTQAKFADKPEFAGKKLEDVENSIHITRLATVEAEMQETADILKNAGLPGWENSGEKSLNVDSEKVKTAFEKLTGEQVWKIRSSLGPQKLKQIFKSTGLENTRVDVAEILKDKDIQTITKKLLPEMVQKIMTIESGGKQFAVSPTGALGCMQLTKWIYHDFGEPINPFDPKQAVKKAAEHLADEYEKSGKNEETTVRTYNGGANYASNSGADPRYFEKYQNA